MADSDDSSSFQSNIANKESQKSIMQVTIPGKDKKKVIILKAAPAVAFKTKYCYRVPNIGNGTTITPGIPHIIGYGEGSLLPPPLLLPGEIKDTIEGMMFLLSMHVDFMTHNCYFRHDIGPEDVDSSFFQSGKNNTNNESQKFNKQLTIPEGKRMVDCMSDYENRGIAGTPLAHVFSISFNPDIEKCELYGKIWVEDDMGTVDYLFNLEREEATLVFQQSSGNSLSLYQTNRAILATNYFKVLFHLKSGDSDILEGSFCWCGKTSEDYDKLLRKTIRGDAGSATVTYIVHSLAIEGHIVPRFKKSDTGSSKFRVKGTIIAHYRNMRYDIDPSDGILEEYSQVKILEGIGVEVDDKETFIIDKSVLAIPIYSPLVIEVDLYEDEGGKVVWKEEVEFSIKEIMYRVENNIPGSNGCLSLTVFGINYGDLPFFQLEKRKAMWRKNGLIIFRWSYEEYVESSIDSKVFDEDDYVDSSIDSEVFDEDCSNRIDSKVFDEDCSNLIDSEVFDEDCSNLIDSSIDVNVFDEDCSNLIDSSIDINVFDEDCSNLSDSSIDMSVFDED